MYCALAKYILQFFSVSPRALAKEHEVHETMSFNILLSAKLFRWHRQSRVVAKAIYWWSMAFILLCLHCNQTKYILQFFRVSLL